MFDPPFDANSEKISSQRSIPDSINFYVRFSSDFVLSICYILFLNIFPREYTERAGDGGKRTTAAASAARSKIENSII